MTAPSLLDELEAVVRLSELATPGPFVVDDWGDVTANGEDVVARIATNYVEDEPDANLLASAVNFIRAHHAEIAEALKDMARMDWLCSDEVHWIEIQSNPRGDYVYVGTDDRTPLRRKIDAAIDVHNSAREGGE